MEVKAVRGIVIDLEAKFLLKNKISSFSICYTYGLYARRQYFCYTLSQGGSTLATLMRQYLCYTYRLYARRQTPVLYLVPKKALKKLRLKRRLR